MLPDFFFFLLFPEGWRLALEWKDRELVSASSLPASLACSQGGEQPRWETSVSWGWALPPALACLVLSAPGLLPPILSANHSWRAQTSSTNSKQISFCKYFLPSIQSIFSNSSFCFSWQKWNKWKRSPWGLQMACLWSQSVINRLASNLHKCIKVLFFLNHRRMTPTQRRATPARSTSCAAPSLVSWGAGGRRRWFPSSPAHPAPSPWDGPAGDREDVLRSMTRPLQGWDLGDSQGKASCPPYLAAGSSGKTWAVCCRLVAAGRAAGASLRPGDKVGLLRWASWVSKQSREPSQPQCPISAWPETRFGVRWGALLAAKVLQAATRGWAVVLGTIAVRSVSQSRCLTSLLPVCCKGAREFTQSFLVSHVQPGKHLKLVPLFIFHQAPRCLAVIADHSVYGDTNA